MSRTTVSDRQSRDYAALVAHPHGSFNDERPPMFSPAAAAQDPSNLRGTFGSFGPLFLPLEYVDGWQHESVAHLRSCYLGDWTSLAKVLVTGADALTFLSWLGMNDLSRFDLGQVKHHVQLDENGWVASEGVICRLGETEFMYTAGSADWLQHQLAVGEWDAAATEVSAQRFIFAAQGPTSLFALQRAAGEDLRDVRFNHSRRSSIAGCDVRILRTGISGELGYEIHGRADDASAVWTAILEAGSDYGIQRLGFRSQPVQHIEAGIATNGLDYLPASAMQIGPPRQFRQGAITGSFVPTAFPDYFRRPDELGWGGRGARPEHDFLGRDALLRARESEQRTLSGLRWRTDDVVEVFASMFDETPAEQMDVPRRAGPAFDRVLSDPDGIDVGVSTGRTISLGLRATISLAVLDQASAAPGTELTLIWGSPNSPQRRIRVTTTSLPFKADNRRVDVASLTDPAGV